MVAIRNFQTCRRFSEEFVGATLMTYAGEQGLKCCAEEQFCLFFFNACKIKKGGWEGSGKVGTRQAGCAAQDSVLS